MRNRQGTSLGKPPIVADPSQDRKSAYLDAAVKLHDYLTAAHLSCGRLIGPDPGIRINYRIGRFIKSYLSAVGWKDDYYYLQAQGYWVLANWRLWNLRRDARYRQMAIDCSRSMLIQQRDDGAWAYPNREWRGRIATAEGTWGSIGLLETYRHTGKPEFLDGAVRWHRFLQDSIGFQEVGGGLAVNYFAEQCTATVPNNSAFVLRFLAALGVVSGESVYLSPCNGLLRFLQRAQSDSGEFPYSLGSPGRDERPHFQCYQYNAFQCLDLMAYYEMTGDTAASVLFTKTLKFLRNGLAPDGHALYDCHNRRREVFYHAAAVSAAFRKAGQLGITGYERLNKKGFKHLIAAQCRDGRFTYSRRDYQLLKDSRSYPRYLAIILYLLLLQETAVGESAGSLGLP